VRVRKDFAKWLDLCAFVVFARWMGLFVCVCMYACVCVCVCAFFLACFALGTHQMVRVVCA
jgi:hypothetical protein